MMLVILRVMLGGFWVMLGGVGRCLRLIMLSLGENHRVYRLFGPVLFAGRNNSALIFALA